MSFTLSTESNSYNTHLDLSLHILDGVGRLYLEGDGLARQGLHEDLHLPTLDF
jgi:hypothetical protein